MDEPQADDRTATPGAPRWLRPAASVGAALLAAGFLAAVGDLFFWHHFADDPSLCVATATGFLAAVTILVVADARDQSATAQEELRQLTRHAQAAQDQVDAVREATEASKEVFQASYRPLLADIPFDPNAGSETVSVRPTISFEVNDTQVLVDASDAGTVVSIPLRNAGTGIAVLTSSGIAASGSSGGLMAHTSTVINPDGRCRITCWLPNDRADWTALRQLLADGAPVVVSAGYLDQAGGAWRTDAHLHRADTDRWYVRQIAFFPARATEPLFTSGPADVHGVPESII
jgi:hypothetical protein